jgi:hypothetical protein
MNKSQLLNPVCALTLFTMISSANAAIISSDDTAITSTDRSSGQTLHVEKSGNYKNRIASESSHADSHINLWLLLITAAVFGVLSEIFHRRSFNQ